MTSRMRGEGQTSGVGIGGEPLTAVVAAMREEVSALLPMLTGARRLPLRGVSVTLGRLGSAAVAVAVTGDGERNARHGLAALMAAVPVGRMLVVGVAGALDPTLGPADLIYCDHVLDAITSDAGGLYRGDAALTAAAARVPHARRGVAVTTGRIADTAAEKSRLRALAMTRAMEDGAPPPAAVVDLESAVFASAAERAGVPWLVWRVVTDTSDEALPPLLNQSRDEGGSVRRGRVVRALLGNPGALGGLLALRGRVRAGAAQLARAVALTLGGGTLPLVAGTAATENTTTVATEQ
jgi:adenosylhomocysteine nucleosidase